MPQSGQNKLLLISQFKGWIYGNFSVQTLARHYRPSKTILLYGNVTPVAPSFIDVI